MDLNLSSGSGLTELELQILDFERQWWRYAGAKESSIKELFDLTPPAYYQLLNNLIDRSLRGLSPLNPLIAPPPRLAAPAGFR